jgi:hypothetical protein
MKKFKYKEWITENKYGKISEQETDQDKSEKDTENAPKKFPFIGPKGKEFEVMLFDICPSAEALYTELQDKTFRDNPEMLNILKSAAIQHERLFAIEKIAIDDKSASKAQIKCAEGAVQNIKKFAREMDKENEHNYLQAHIDKIKKIHKEKPREDKDSDCPDTEDVTKKNNFKNLFKISKQSTTYGPSNPAPTYSEGLKEIATELGYLNKEENYQNLPTPDEISLSYTDPGFRFYGMYLYKDGNRFAKISYEDRATKYLKNLGVNTEVPRRYDTDTLDKIKQEIEALGIEGDYSAAMDVS